ncbi:MAG TPA: histidine kinase dimerization/phospho-acceptor domain-containing protein, partial [Dehalococcoidia bacterium]|nr:histidine kinase dimerization/phospho-acceptor domain-containing protein [Dehalococcoidia bacterium]
MLGSVRFRIVAGLFSLLTLTFIASAAAPLLVAIAIGALAATGLALLLSAALVTPLQRISRSALGIAAGNLDERVSPRPSGEIGELADAFNQMGRSLEELLAAASHDRTRMLAALNSSVDAVVALDDQDRVKFANLAAERLLLRPEKDMVGTLFSWMMPDQSFLDALRASREDANRQSLVIERANRRYLQALVAPIIGGGDWATLIVFHDVTDTRRAEQVRRDFVANVSHELRTPLAALKSVIETLHAGAIDDPATARDFLSRAEDEMDRLVLMVEELLQLSRIESGELPLSREPLDMRDVLTNAVDRMKTQADRKGVSLTLDLAQATPSVIADRELLERAVVNLIHNAVKFT